MRNVWRIYNQKGRKTNLLPVRQGARGSRAPEVAQKPNIGWGREVSCILGPPVRKSFISIPISNTPPPTPSPPFQHPSSPFKIHEILISAFPNESDFHSGPRYFYSYEFLGILKFPYLLSFLLIASIFLLHHLLNPIW